MNEQARTTADEYPWVEQDADRRAYDAAKADAGELVPLRDVLAELGDLGAFDHLQR